MQKRLLLKLNNRKGFSIGEVLIAAFVLTVGIVGTLGLLVSSTNHCIDARKQVIASKLAEEGIEIVRNLRDTNIARSRTAFEYYFPIADNNSCIIDASSHPNIGSLEPPVGYCQCYLPQGDCLNFGDEIDHKTLYEIDDINALWAGIYIHPLSLITPSAVPTPFKRVIMYDYDGTDRNNSSYVKVQSVVVWGESFPGTNFDDLHSHFSELCNTSSKCVYAETILRKM